MFQHNIHQNYLGEMNDWVVNIRIERFYSLQVDLITVLVLFVVADSVLSWCCCCRFISDCWMRVLRDFRSFPFWSGLLGWRRKHAQLRSRLLHLFLIENSWRNCSQSLLIGEKCRSHFKPVHLITGINGTKRLFKLTFQRLNGVNSLKTESIIENETFNPMVSSCCLSTLIISSWLLPLWIK